MIKNKIHKNPKNPPVSLVIPAFNEESFIGRTLASILDQDFKDFELIVVDNNSTDKTAEIARQYGAKVVFEKERKASCARQAGFMAAKGKIIATTDADTILPRTWLSQIVGEFKKNKNLVVFGGPFYFYSGSLVARFTMVFLSPLLWNIDRVLSGGWSIPGVNLAIKKDAFDKIDGFNTNLNVGEDAEICQRLRKIGEVGFDLNHRVLTSGRRYRNGILGGLVYYLPHYLMKVFFKKYQATPFPPIRSEESLLKKYVYIPLLAAIILTFILFGFNYYQVSYGKEVIDLKQKITDLVEQKIINNLTVTPFLRSLPTHK